MTEAVPTAHNYLPDLRRPFAADAVKFKVQAFKNGKGVVVSYIDARLVIERLNLVCGLDWSDDYREIPGGIRCDLTVGGTTRSDVGEPGSSPQGKTPKAVVSDALKRAAVKFGVGVSIYALPTMRIDSSDVWMAGPEKVGGLKDAAIGRIRRGYETWLKNTGVPLFGEPIDHGDAVDAVGDYEVGAVEEIDLETGQATPRKRSTAPPTAVAGPSPTAPPKSGVVTGAQITKIWARAKAAGLDEAEVHEVLSIVAKVDSLKELPAAKMDLLLEKMVPFRAWKDAQAMPAAPNPDDYPLNPDDDYGR